jgi:hypothetical protein
VAGGTPSPLNEGRLVQRSSSAVGRVVPLGAGRDLGADRELGDLLRAYDMEVGALALDQLAQLGELFVGDPPVAEGAAVAVPDRYRRGQVGQGRVDRGRVGWAVDPQGGQQRRPGRIGQARHRHGVTGGGERDAGVVQRGAAAQIQQAAVLVDGVEAAAFLGEQRQRVARDAPRPGLGVEDRGCVLGRPGGFFERCHATNHRVRGGYAFRAEGPENQTGQAIARGRR